MELDPNLLAAVLQGIHPSCSVESLPYLSSNFRLQAFKRGSPILHQGDIWKEVYLIKRGVIRLYFLRSDGKEFNKNFMAESSVVCPLTAAMSSNPSLFGISAIENTEIWCCSVKLFKNTLGTDSWQAIQRELLSRLIDSKLQREHDLLALDGRRRYEKLYLDQPGLAERIPLLHLATYLGMSDVSLSRIRHAKSNKKSQIR